MREFPTAAALFLIVSCSVRPSRPTPRWRRTCKSCRTPPLTWRSGQRCEPSTPSTCRSSSPKTRRPASLIVVVVMIQYNTCKWVIAAISLSLTARQTPGGRFHCCLHCRRRCGPTHRRTIPCFPPAGTGGRRRVCVCVCVCVGVCSLQATFSMIGAFWRLTRADSRVCLRECSTPSNGSG